MHHYTTESGDFNVALLDAEIAAVSPPPPPNSAAAAPLLPLAPAPGEVDVVFYSGPLGCRIEERVAGGAVFVARVAAGGAADANGLCVGDEVVGVGGRRSPNLAAATEALRAQPRPVSVRVRRGDSGLDGLSALRGESRQVSIERASLSPPGGRVGGGLSHF